jgi:hypothetical protein
MLFTREFKDGIRAGRVTRTYRAWKRPQAKVGGRYNLHPDGVIEVTAMTTVDVADVTDRHARRAGFTGAAELRTFLKRASGGIYQVDFRYLGTGAVRTPERSRLGKRALSELTARLDRMDARAAHPWTRAALTLIDEHPGTRAADLAPSLGWETARFKAEIRKLKALGLTVSLDVGYRLSPRGAQVLGLGADRGDT